MRTVFAGWGWATTFAGAQRHVDGAHNAVFRQLHEWCYCFIFELNEISPLFIGHTHCFLPLLQTVPSIRPGQQIRCSSADISQRIYQTHRGVKVVFTLLFQFQLLF